MNIRLEKFHLYDTETITLVFDNVSHYLYDWLIVQAILQNNAKLGF